MPRVPLCLGVLMAVSAALRSRHMDVGLWVDEGLSIGIAERPLADIPGLLRQDGSPPLYYLLLHVWMGVAGDSEAATRALSLLFALLSVPAAYWAGRLAFDARTGWIAAVLAALNPFMTQYAQETRMYTLVVLLGLLAVACWLRALRTGTHAFGFAACLAALLYTHNWALFLGAALAVSWLVLLVRAARRREPASGCGVAGARDGERAALLRTGAIGFGGAALLYLPWLPTLLYQTAHTGAPWTVAPDLDALLAVPALLFGDWVWLAVIVAAIAGRAPKALSIVAALTVLIPWLASQIEPAWSARYLAAALAPALLLIAAAMARAGRVGLACLAVTAIAWAATDAPAEKSNIRAVTTVVGPLLRAGDLVIATRPADVPALRYYLPPGLRYATLTGPVRDPGLVDMRDTVARLGVVSAARDLRPLLDALRPGRRLALFEPIVYEPSRWTAPSTSLVRLRTEQWSLYVSEDPRFRMRRVAPKAWLPRKPNPVTATVYVKERRRASRWREAGGSAIPMRGAWGS